MASEKMSESEMAKLSEPLAKAKRSGYAPEELLQGPMPSGKVERSQGSMSDSSKRRLVAPEEFEILEPPFVSEAGHSTLVKESEIVDFGKGDVNVKIPVPREVKDGRQWGRTLMQLPALKSRNLSYEEIFDLVVERMPTLPSTVDGSWRLMERQ